MDFETIKPLVFKSKKFTSDFSNYLEIQFLRHKEDSYKYTIKELILSYCSREMSLSKIYSYLKELDADYLEDLIQYKDFPSFKSFISCIPKQLEGKSKFNIVEGLLILESYGRSRTIGLNKKQAAYFRDLRAKKQVSNFKIKDMQGLLGVTNQFKKEFDPKNSKRKSNSIWTVKK